MKTKYKYLILILITIFASVCIYRYVEASKPVDTSGDVLVYQNTIENNIINNGTYSINEPKVVLDPYTISPLSAMIVFTTNDLASATVTIHGKDDDEDIVNTFLPSKLHILPIYGLYPDYQNKVTINCSGESKTVEIKTNALPDDVKNIDADNLSDDTKGFYFTTANDGKPVAYDKNGHVRWYLTNNYKWEFTRLSNGHILLGNSSLIKAPYYSTGLVEMDMLGKIYYEYNTPGGYHHDVYELANGNLLVLSNNPNRQTVEDYIVELDRNTGQVVKELKPYKLFPKTDKKDWLMLNSIVYDAKSNSVTVCGNNQNMLINLDYSSGELNWIIGDAPKGLDKYVLKGDVTVPTNPQGLVLTDEGYTYINDNKELVVYSVDAVNKTVQEKNKIDLSDNAHNMTYNNDEYLITSGKEIKAYKDEITTLFKTDYDLYSARYMNIYAGDMYTTGKGQRLGSLGVTKTTDNPFFILWKLDNSIYKKYDLSLSKDVNRLVVNGTFNKNDKVEIILDNILNKSTYKVDIDKKSAKDGKVKTSTYINEEGLDGKYYIYLKVNNDIYKLEKYTIFY